jgi:hypothetical protein
MTKLLQRGHAAAGPWSGVASAELQRKKKPAAPGGGATGYVLAGEGSGGTGVIVLPK